MEFSMVYSQETLIEKKQRGQYFTDPAIARKIVGEVCDKILSECFWNSFNINAASISPELTERLFNSILSLRFVDPAMGEGVFLEEIMIYFEKFLIELSINLNSSPLKEQISIFFRKKLALEFSQVSKEDTFNLDIWRLYILRSMLYGVDLDKNIIKKARNTLIGHINSPQIFKLANLFCKMNIRQGNSLISPISMKNNFNQDLLNIYSNLDLNLLPLRSFLQKVPWNEIDVNDLENSLIKVRTVQKELTIQILSQMKKNSLFNHSGLANSSFIWEIEFPEVFFSNLVGFSAVLGNPPWDKWKMYNREWLGSTSLSQSNYAQKIEKIRIDDVKADQDYLAIKSYYKKTSKYFDSSYKWQPGEKNLYKLFLERFYYLCSSNGYLGVILPGGLLGEYYSEPLRLMLLTKMNLHTIIEIVSNDEMFPDAEPGLSILIIIAQKKESEGNFLFAKGINSIDDFISLDTNERNENSDKVVIFGKKDILEKSPKFIIPSVQNTIEFRITEKITKYPSLSSSEWGCKTSRGLDMTNDRSLLSTEPNTYPLIEGRHLVRLGYDNNYPRYWVKSIEKYKEITPFWNQKIIAWKNFSGNHRRRRMRIAILPPMTTISNSVICLYQLPTIPDVEYYLAGVMCSIPFEFRIRQLCYGLNINQYVIDGITVPRFDPELISHQRMVNLVKNFFPRGREWATRKMKANSSLSKARLEQDYLNDVTKIDATASTIYNLSRDEFEVTLMAHPLLEQEYRDIALSHFSLFSK